MSRKQIIPAVLAAALIAPSAASAISKPAAVNLQAAYQHAHCGPAGSKCITSGWVPATCTGPYAGVSPMRYEWKCTGESWWESVRVGAVRSFVGLWTVDGHLYSMSVYDDD